MAVAALLLTGILTFNNFDGAVKVEAARNTLDRIETITSDHTSENSSWKILEIVPGASVNIPADAANDVKEAALPAGNIGYLIGGQEPYKKLSDYEERSNMIRYLKSKNALSAITGENAPLTAMGGDYREYLEDMIEESVSVDQITSIGTGDIVSFNTISMLRDISGNYVKLFISNNGIIGKCKSYDNEPFWGCTFKEMIFNNSVVSLTNDNGTYYKIYFSAETYNIIFPNSFKNKFKIITNNLCSESDNIIICHNVFDNENYFPLKLSNDNMTITTEIDNINRFTNKNSEDKDKTRIKFEDIDYIILPLIMFKRFHVQFDGNNNIISFYTTDSSILQRMTFQKTLSIFLKNRMIFLRNHSYTGEN